MIYNKKLIIKIKIMNIIQVFSNLLKSKAEGNENATPERFCPNCWGNKNMEVIFMKP